MTGLAGQLARAGQWTRAGQWAPAGLIVLAVAVGGATPVAAQGLGLPGDWAGYFGVGVSRIATEELHERLAAGGYPSFDRTTAGVNIGAYGTLRSGLMLGAEWHFLPVGGDTHEGRDMGLGAGHGTLGVGYAVELSPRTRVYPRLGLGVGGFGLWLETEADTLRFDDVLADPDTRLELGRSGFRTLSRDNMVIDVGAGAEFLPGGRGFGALIGLRVGYLFVPFTTDWHVKGRELSGGPAATVAGPYVRVIAGAARRR